MKDLRQSVFSRQRKLAVFSFGQNLRRGFTPIHTDIQMIRANPRRLPRTYTELMRHLFSAAVLLALAFAQSQPDPHQIPVMDGEAGPCSVAFTVTDGKGAPVYDARIRVHIAYGFAGVRKLDLEAATNVDGKTQFKGLPQKVKGGILTFNASKDKLEGSATYDPAKNCSEQQSSIVLAEK